LHHRKAFAEDAIEGCGITPAIILIQRLSSLFDIRQGDGKLIAISLIGLNPEKELAYVLNGSSLCETGWIEPF